jgi:glutaredoxin 3
MRKPHDIPVDVVVYTTPVCPYCVQAKRLLGQRGIAYEEVDVSRDAEGRDWLAEASGQLTVPQIFIKGRSVGGYTELSALDRRGELRALLAG